MFLAKLITGLIFTLLIYEGAYSLTVIGIVIQQVQILNKSVCISHSANTLGKGINSPSSYG